MPTVTTPATTMIRFCNLVMQLSPSVGAKKPESNSLVAERDRAATLRNENGPAMGWAVSQFVVVLIVAAIRNPDSRTDAMHLVS